MEQPLLMLKCRIDSYTESCYICCKVVKNTEDDDGGGKVVSKSMKKNGNSY